MPIAIATRQEFDIVKTFECGQCFRWNADADGVYTGVAKGRAARLWTQGETVYISANARELKSLWRDYFDLSFDYESVRQSFDAGAYMDSCARFGQGLRILRQDRWETLCSFIISQCNNIARIKKIVERLCTCFGEPLEFESEILYAFPSAERIAALEPEDLSPLRSGYRAAYIINAARAVAEGRLDLDALAQCGCDQARAALKSLDGVGDKVANCVNLFGLGHMEAFPIDVWMRRALREHFDESFDPAQLGAYAGLAQQYIFYYTRSGGKQN